MPDGKNLGGRPRKEIDLDQLKAMVQIQCTAEECARVLDVDDNTIDRRLKEAGYAGFGDFYKRYSSEGKASLRRLQWASAKTGNVTMQIWLGKQNLSQSDRNETTHKVDPGIVSLMDQVNGTSRSK